MDPVKTSQELKLKAKQYIYMVLVGIISLVVLFILPLFNVGNESISFQFPQTRDAWIMYIALRCVISFINVFIYICFVRQGRSNSLKNEDFIKANALLGKYIDTSIKPRSPTKFTGTQYGVKSTMILLASVVALVALPPIVAYDWKMASTYILTLVLSITFGIYQMKITEAYWCEEFPRWVEFTIEQRKAAEKAQKEEEQVQCTNMKTKSIEI